MKTTKALFFILVLLVGTRVSMAQQPQTAPLSTDEVTKTVELLSRYFETYESETYDGTINKQSEAIIAKS